MDCEDGPGDLMKLNYHCDIQASAGNKNNRVQVQEVNETFFFLQANTSPGLLRKPGSHLLCSKYGNNAGLIVRNFPIIYAGSTFFHRFFL